MKSVRIMPFRHNGRRMADLCNNAMVGALPDPNNSFVLQEDINMAVCCELRQLQLTEAPDFVGSNVPFS
jgi:hypothetical protein